MLDSTDADAVRDVEAEIDVSKALFVVSSKSGGTIETLSAFHYFWEKTGGNGAQFVAVTDPGSGLAAAGRASAASGASSSTTPTSAAATARCRTSGSSRRRCWAPT